MEHFDGDELITVPYEKYRYLLECKKRANICPHCLPNALPPVR